jgi:hypothetical protein
MIGSLSMPDTVHSAPNRGDVHARRLSVALTAHSRADEGSRQPFAVEPLMRRNLALPQARSGAARAERGYLPC